MFDRPKIQTLYDHVDHTRFHIVEMGYQMVQLLSADNAEQTIFVNFTPAVGQDLFQIFAAAARDSGF